jgi:uncharacterized repeat protein (TIGR01451 family)
MEKKKMTRLVWPLLLGLGLTLTLLWVLTPHQAIEAQAAGASLSLDATAANVNPGFTVDLVREAVWGLVNPGDTVTVTRTSGGAAYGAAQADGVGFFWTPVHDGSGEPVGLHGGETVEIYVNDALAATVNPMTITGEIDVLADRVVGAISGDTGGTPVTVTVGLWGGVFRPGMPLMSATTDASGVFSVTFGDVDLDAQSLAAVDYRADGNHVRGYLYPGGPVFLVQQYDKVVGYAPRFQTVTATVYMTYPSHVRWQDSAYADFPHGFYTINGDSEPGDVVELELEQGDRVSATLAHLENLSFDTSLEEVYGSAPSGENVRVSMWQQQGDDELVYTQTFTTAVAGDRFTATFPSADMRPRDFVDVVLADANGNQTQLFSGPPFLNVSLDPYSEWDCAWGRVDAPYEPVTLTLQISGGATYTREMTLPDSDAGNLVGSPWLCYLVWGPGWGPIDFSPGDTVTLQSATWSDSVVVADLSWQADAGNEQITGQAPSGELEISVYQWHDYQYPLNGSATQTATAASPYSATFADFDVRDGNRLRVIHYDPASDFATQVDAELRFFEVDFPHGVGAPQFSDSDVLTATLYESDGVTLKYETSQDGDLYHADWYWLDLGGMIEPGDWISVTDDAGWAASLQVPYLDVQAHAADYIWGVGPTALLHVDYEREQDDWDGYFVPVDDDGNSYVLHTGFYGHDLQWGNRASVNYQAPNGNRVWRGFDWPQIVANYDAEGWNAVWGDHAFSGTYVLLTVTHPLSGVIATASVLPGACNWCDADDYDSQDLLPNGVITPGNVVEAKFDDGYVDSVLVLPLDAEANPDTDVVTVTAPVSTSLFMNADNNFDGQWDSDTQTVGASGYVTFDLAAEGYDILPGTRFNVHSIQAHGHNTHYSFRLPAPDLRIDKWHPGNYARPGGVQVYGVFYINEGDGVAENVRIVDTLPTSLTYAADTSGVLPGIGMGGVLTWDLGRLDPGDRGAFIVTLDVPANMPTGSGVILSNCASITTTTQPESDLWDNEDCVAPVDVWEDDVEIDVDKWVFPSDPTPGQELIYTIQWCNNRGAAAGPAWLTDTLPSHTSLVSWGPENWWDRFWVEMSASDQQLALYSPGLPGDRCYKVYVTLLLDSDAPISTTLENEVVIATAGDVDEDNNYRFNDEAHVSPARHDLRLEKYFNSGVLVPGGWINYTFHYYNDGNITTHVWLTDTLPQGLSYDYAYWGGGQPDADEPLPDPIIIGDELFWDLDDVAVGGSRWFHLQVNISDSLASGTAFTNCATVNTSNFIEDTPWDNRSCYAETVNALGPNLRVYKSHSWDGDGQLDYDIRFENVGDEIVSDVWITDYLPAGTTWNGWWNIDSGWDERLLTYTESSNLLTWNLSELYPGDYGGLHFEADLDEPGLLMQWFTNSVEISTPLSETTPGDNVYDDEAFSGMAQLMVWIDDPDGNPANGHVAIWDEWGGFVTSEGARPDMPAMFADLEVGASYWVQAWPPFTERPDWANSVKELVTIGDELIVFGLALQHPNITGVIRTPEGDPLPAVYDGQGNPTYPAAAHIHNEDWSIDLHVATNPEGEFGMAMPHDDYILRGEPAQELVFTYTQSLPHAVTASNVPQDVGEVRLTYPRVWGWVVDPDGNRVSTWVSVWREDGEYWDGDDTFAPGEGDDPFRLGGLPAGLYNVQADPPTHNPEGYGSSKIMTFTVEADSWYDPGSTEQLTLTLRPANFVGDVLFPSDFDDCPDCPVQWADVRLRDTDWNFEHWRNTGEDGRVAFSGLEAGDYVVDVFLPGHLAIEWDPPLREEFSLASSDDQVTRTLYLQYATLNKHVVGEVRYDDGSPVGDADGDGEGDAWVYAYHWDTGGWTGVANDPDGSYDLGLKGGLWTLGVDPTHPDVDWHFDPDVGEQWIWFPYSPTLELYKTVVFTVTRAEYFHVTGQMLDSGGAPPPSDKAGIELCTDEGDCFGTTVEAGGHFTVPILPGFYHAWVWVDPDTGLLPPLHNGFPVFVNQHLDLGVLQLRSMSDRTATVSGRVVISPTGQGAVGVEVEAWTDEGDWASTETITEGNYVLNLLPGDWHAGPVLSPWQEENFVVLPPRHRHGHLEAHETISNVNFYVRYRDATIQGQLVNEEGEVITDPELSAVVLAEVCPLDPDLPCWVVDETEARGSTFELRVVGGVSYTLSVWVQSGRYLPGSPQDVHVGVGETKTGVQLTLVEAETRIWGQLHDGQTGEVVEVEAIVYGGDSEGQYWVEDYLWPDKEPYQYDLYVPTPNTQNVTWTLGLWVDASTGYVADPASPYYEVVIEPGVELAWQPLKVKKLDTIISGTVSAGGAPAPYVWVFAGGEGDLYFETQTNAQGEFSMYVLPGEYMVGVHLPPHLEDDYFPPQLVEWDAVDDNPVNLAFRPRAGQEVEISGSLSVVPAGALPDDAQILVFGWTDDFVASVVIGTLADGYHLPVAPNTTWHVWAAYEDPENDTFYYAYQARDVNVGDSAVSGIDLVLVRANFELPDTECWTFDPAQPKRLSLPPWGDLLPPLVEIQAGTMPVGQGEDTVEVCVTPKIAVRQGANLVGFAYEIEARDSQGNLITQDFNHDVRLIFYFNQAALPAGADPQDLVPAFYSTSRQEWIPLENVFVDEDDWFVTGRIGHFSQMGVLSTPAAERYVYLPLLLRTGQ